MKRIYLLTSQINFLQDISQMIEGCPNLYAIQSNISNVSVLNKLILKARGLFEDNEGNENDSHIALLGQTIKNVYELSKDITDENFFIYVVGYKFPIQFYDIEVITNEDFEEWKEETDTFEDCVNYYVQDTRDEFEQRLLKCKIIK